MARSKNPTKTELHEEEENYRFMATSLITGLKPTFSLNTANHGSDNLEGFLEAVGKPSPRRIYDADTLNYLTRKPEKSAKSFRN